MKLYKSIGNENLVNTIKRKRSKFSKSQHKIADYILENKEKVIFNSVKKFSELVGVSESTVVRFATELGYSCYKEFQIALEDLIKVESTASKRINATFDKIKDSNKHILEFVLEGEIEKIKRTITLNDTNTFDKAIDKIVSGKKVFILGSRSSYALANYFSFYLNFMISDVEQVEVTNGSEIFEQLDKIKEDDVLIVLSFPRYANKTINIVKQVKKSKVTIIGITDSENSPAGKLSDIVLLATTDMLSLVDSLVSPFSLINAILISISLKNTDKILNKFNNLEEIWGKYDIYYKGIDDNG